MDYAEYLQAKNETRVIRDINGQQMLATIEASTTASKAYAVGDYMIVNDKIYKVTAAIASGGTITVGTNVEEAKVGTELTELNRQLSDLEDTVSTTQIINSASGAIASFADGADEQPIRKLVANIEPVQDLHGYDNPWPAGGGKNLIDYLSCTGIGPRNGTDAKYPEDTTAVTGNQLLLGLAYGNNGGILKGIGTFSMQQGDYITISFDVVSMSGTSNFVIGVGNYDGGGTSNVAGGVKPANNKVVLSVYAKSDYNKTGIFVQPSAANITATIKNLQVERGQVESPSYAPYSNICPISGHTGASVTRTGKNLLDNEHATVYNRYIQYYDTNNANWVESSDSASYCIFVKPNTSYAIKAHGDTTVFRACAISVDPSTIGSNTIHSTNAYSANAGTYKYCVITTGSTETWLVLQLGKTVVENGTGMAMVELGNTYSDYEPYTGNQISITFPSSAGTVYGGTLDVTNGVLTVDRAMVDISTLDFSASAPANHIFRTQSLYGLIKGPASNAIPSNAICSEFYAMGYGPISATDNGAFAVPAGGIPVVFIDHRYSSVEDFISGNSGTQFVYPLATPITYQLTPQQLDTLLGTNNILSSTGDTEVTYPADTKLYIEQLTKPTEDDMTADHAISAGTFFMIGNTLYLATAQIAAGATITPGTNATKLSLADALNQLNT